MDAINGSMATLKDDLTTLRPLIKTLKETALNAYPTESLSNQAVASFTDGAKDIPVKSLSVAITPIQNLNGYANPWPAGGGKNKVVINSFADIVKHDITFKYENPSEINISGTATANAYMFSTIGDNKFTLPAGTYTISTNMPSGGSNGYLVLYINENGTWTALVNYIRSPYGQTFTLSATKELSIQAVVVNGQSINMKVWVQIESGSSATAYTPSANICPISGHTECKVTRTGVNVWDEQIRNGYYSTVNGAFTARTNMIANANPIPVLPNTTYYAKSGTYNIIPTFYDENMTFISQAAAKKNATFTTPNNCRYINFSNSWDEGNTDNHDISINYPSTATAYEPFGQTYLTDWGTNLLAPRDTASNIYNAGHLIPVKSGETIYFYGEWTYTSSAILYARVFTASTATAKTESGSNPSPNSFNSGTAKSMVMPADGYLGVCYNTGVSTYTISKLMVSRSPITSAADYRPYADPFVGVVYGGTLDVTTGVLTVTHAYADMGTFSWQLSGSSPNSFYAQTPFYYGLGDTEMKCSTYGFAGAVTSDYYTEGKLKCYYRPNNVIAHEVYVKDSQYATASDFKTAMSGVQLVYELATPTTVQLTPTEVTTLLGQNNIWADAGNIVEVEYRADTALYIQKLVG